MMRQAVAGQQTLWRHCGSEKRFSGQKWVSGEQVVWLEAGHPSCCFPAAVSL